MFPVFKPYIQMQFPNRWFPEHLLTVLTLMRADERGRVVEGSELRV